MKLKKIASLALAGIMAVSMLAGCAGKNDTADNQSSTTTTQTAVTSANSAIETAVKDYNSGLKITYMDTATVKSGLSKYFSDHTYLEVVNTSDMTTELGKYFTGITKATDYAALNTAMQNTTSSVKYVLVDLKSDAYYNTSVLTMEADKFAAAIKDAKNEFTNTSVDYKGEYSVYAYVGQKAEADGTNHTILVLVVDSEIEKA